MATYFYQATDQTGEIVEGNLDASDYDVAVQKVRSLNYFPIRISADRPKASLFKALKGTSSFTLPFSTLSSYELLSFTQQLATLLSSKLTLDKSLTIATKLTEKERTRATIEDIQKRVHSGTSFADALAAYPRVFSKMYINIVRAGEMGGVLDHVLQRLAEFLEKLEDTKGKIVSAMIYPIILIVAGVSAIIFLMAYVVPKLAGVLGGQGDAVPPVTRALLTISQILNEYWWSLGGGLALMIAGFFIFIKSDTGKNFWDQLILKLPLFSGLVRKIEMSRFARTMSTLLTSGVPVLQALKVVQSVINNQVIAQAMEPLREGLKSGQGISRPLQRSDIFPPMAVHMIIVGEETGELEAMLVRVADAYDREVDNAIQRALKVLEPILVLSIGGSIIFIVASIVIGMMEVSNVIM